jgi:long-chain acyl-CoA synthetase
MWVRGSGIATGYWGDSPFEDGWLKTGDLVATDADGLVWFHGRKKEIIVRGGSNISPQEVEETLYQHPQWRRPASSVSPTATGVKWSWPT